jgi:hypothetical protein
LIASFFVWAASAAAQAPDDKFSRLQVYLERNVTDKVTEMRFGVTAGSSGLASLRILAPNGRVIAEMKAPDSKLGGHQLLVSSPPTPTEGAAQADFPVGTYTFWGTTVGGARLEGSATLGHAFPEAATFVYPKADTPPLAIRGQKLKWQAGKDLAAQVVTVAHPASGNELRLRLAGDASGFGLPDDFLVPEADYKLSIASVAKDGSTTLVYTSFKTRKK